MKRVDTATNAASKPAYAAGPNPNGYFTEGTPGVEDGTIPGQDWCNMVQEEIANAITDDGYSTALDGADDTQLAARLEPTKGIKTHATSLALQSTAHKRVIVACTTASVSGDDAAAIASTGGAVNGAESAALACSSAAVSGDRAAAVAADTSTVSGDQAIAAADKSSTVSGDQSAALASHSSNISGDQAATLACGATGEPVVVEKKKSAAIGCADSFISEPATGDGYSVLLASRCAELPTNYTIAAGYETTPPTQNNTEQNLTWVVDVSLGNVTCDGAFTGGGADLAEFFENLVPGVLGPGLVLAGEGAKVRPAGPGDRIRGVVSASPMLLGNAAGLKWSGRYRRDEWGRRIPYVNAETGLKGFEQSRKYDPNKKYVPRKDRPEEWTPVALTGQVLVRVDDTVKPGDLVGPGKNGVGTKNENAKGRPIECMEIRKGFTKKRGYAIAWCLVG